MIGNYIPDVTGFGNSLWIAECETRGGLAQSHTADQWRTFLAEATRMGGYFIAVVAKVDEVAATALLRTVAGVASNVRLWTF